MRVFGGKYKQLRTPYPDSTWYTIEEQKQGCTFDEWRDMFVKDFKINTAEVVFNGVLDSRPIRITLQQLFDLGVKHPHFGEAIRAIAMKCAYTGENPRDEYVKLIEMNALTGTKWLLDCI